MLTAASTACRAFLLGSWARRLNEIFQFQLAPLNSHKIKAFHWHTLCKEELADAAKQVAGRGQGEEQVEGNIILVRGVRSRGVQASPGDRGRETYTRAADHGHGVFVRGSHGHGGHGRGDHGQGDSPFPLPAGPTLSWHEHDIAGLAHEDFYPLCAVCLNFLNVFAPTGPADFSSDFSSPLG